MNKFPERYGPWAFVGGSAEGLGEAFSAVLARRGLNVVMADRNSPVNQNLAHHLEKTYGIKTLILDLDLSSPDAAATILKTIESLDCRLLIYNAAYSVVKPFSNNSRDDLDRYLAVNCHTPIHLVHGFIRYLTVRNSGGGILLMSSLAGLYGTQLLAPYGATKAFNLILAEALHYEMKKMGIDVMSCIAGATATPAFLATRPEYGLLRPSVMRPSTVAEQALDHLGRKALYIPGLSNRFTHFVFSRLLPRKVAAGLFNRTTWKMYGKHLYLFLYLFPIFYILFSIF